MCPLGMAISPESCHRERSAAIPVVQGWQTKKRDGFAGYPVIARNEAISPFLIQQTDKREIAALRSQ